MGPGWKPVAKSCTRVTLGISMNCKSWEYDGINMDKPMINHLPTGACFCPSTVWDPQISLDELPSIMFGLHRIVRMGFRAIAIWFSKKSNKT
jgi:hypothetical protein